MDTYTNSKGLTLQNSARNVDYSKPSSTRPIAVPELGIYMSKPMVSGNSKLSKNVLIFDLLAVTSCLNCTDCAATCYAMKAQRQYRETYNKRAINTHLAVHHMEVLERELMKQIRGSKRPFVRIHSSGDFFSQDYVDMWNRIVEANKAVTFYFYTKVAHMFDFTTIAGQENCNMVDSILPDGTINYGDFEYIVKKADKFNAVICPYGIKEHSSPVHCGGSCTKCMDNRYVLFLEH